MSRYQSLVRKCDKAFSDFIRYRDTYELGYARCPTCGRLMTYEETDCGHYISRVKMNTRYDEMNCNAQCRHCNRYMEGQHFLYRKWLVEKYGEKAVERLEMKAQMQAGFTCELLEVMIVEFKNKLKGLKNG